MLQVFPINTTKNKGKESCTAPGSAQWDSFRHRQTTAWGSKCWHRSALALEERVVLALRVLCGYSGTEPWRRSICYGQVTTASSESPTKKCQCREQWEEGHWASRLPQRDDGIPLEKDWGL